MVGSQDGQMLWTRIFQFIKRIFHNKFSSESISSVISPSNKSLKFHQLEMDEVKLCVLGSTGMVKKLNSLLGAGKSNFVFQYIQNFFIDENDPTIDNIHRKQISFQDKTIILQIYDSNNFSDYGSYFIF
jgi:hypothetical protein